MTYDVDTNGKIHYIQKAIWRLESAIAYLIDANGPRDPEIEQIGKIIDRLNAELDVLSS